MSWEEHQLELTRYARLLLSSPASVFAELQEYSKKVRASKLWLAADSIEPLLVERGERLINLGLACYCTDKSVFRALYSHGLGEPTDALDGQYRRGLLLGCVSNATIQKAHLLLDFPHELIGDEELERILLEREYTLAETLIRNPEVSDQLLEQLYKREGAFAKVADERLAALISSSRHNERINTNNDDDYSPDLGHYRIHDAIWQLVETAPINSRWMWVLYDFLNSLSPTHVARTERLLPTLARWKQLEVTNSDGKESTGLFAETISGVDEFRCIVASLYGAGLKDEGLRAASKSSDVAIRAAYYGRGSLTLKEMRAAYERDGSAFVLAAIRNTSVICRREQRQLFEEEMLSKDFSLIYRNFVDLIRRDFSYFED